MAEPLDTVNARNHHRAVRQAGARRHWVRRVALWLLGLLIAAVGVVLVVSWAPDVPVDQLKARWAQFPSTFVEVQGMAVHLRDEGPREGAAHAPDGADPVVLLHGTSASLHTWQGWTDRLSVNRRVIRFDLPGFALTGPHPQDDYTIDAYVRFVHAMLDHLKVQRVVLGGNSLGGQIAWAFARAAPERVGRLILVDATGYTPQPQLMPLGFRLAQKPALSPVFERLLPTVVIEQTVRDVYGNPALVTPELVELYRDMTLRAGNRRALSIRMRAGYQGNEADIRALKTPTLILWGGKDRLVPPSRADDFERDIKGARKIVFPTLGHVPHEEDPAVTVSEVMEFLDGGLPPTR